MIIAMPRDISQYPDRDIDRFLSKIDKTAPDGCWLWTAGKFSPVRHGFGRYGAFWVGGKMRYAHRVAWEIFIGDIPSDMNVLHSCDNPPCCNPEHLFLGTQLDNVRDMISKGRADISGLLYSGKACLEN